MKKEISQRVKYRRLTLAYLTLQQNLSYYKWQVKLRKQMGAKYEGLSLGALQSKVRALEYSIPEFDKFREAQNPNPGTPKRTNWGL